MYCLPISFLRCWCPEEALQIPTHRFYLPILLPPLCSSIVGGRMGSSVGSRRASNSRTTILQVPMLLSVGVRHARCVIAINPSFLYGGGELEQRCKRAARQEAACSASVFRHHVAFSSPSQAIGNLRSRWFGSAQPCAWMVVVDTSG